MGVSVCLDGQFRWVTRFLNSMWFESWHQVIETNYGEFIDVLTCIDHSPMHFQGRTYAYCSHCVNIKQCIYRFRLASNIRYRIPITNNTESTPSADLQGEVKLRQRNAWSCVSQSECGLLHWIDQYEAKLWQRFKQTNTVCMPNQSEWPFWRVYCTNLLHALGLRETVIHRTQGFDIEGCCSYIYHCIEGRTTNQLMAYMTVLRRHFVERSNRVTMRC